mgnify:CR=1 FL=1
MDVKFPVYQLGEKNTIGTQPHQSIGVVNRYKSRLLVIVIAAKESHLLAEAFPLERLHDEIHGPYRIALHRILTEVRNKDDLHPLVNGSNLFRHLNAVCIGHLDVEKHRIVALVKYRQEIETIAVRIDDNLSSLLAGKARKLSMSSRCSASSSTTAIRNTGASFPSANI